MKKQINIEIGLRIRKKRESFHFTREQLAEKIDISSAFLSEVELGKKGTSPSTITKLCDALHVSADYLIRGKERSANSSEIMELISDLDDESLHYLEEIVRNYIKSIDVKNSK